VSQVLRGGKFLDFGENMAGYSSTPLAKKLGIKEGTRIALVNAPENFQAELGELPERVEFVKRLTNSLDIIVFFVLSERELAKDFANLAKKLTTNGMIWIAWRKKSSGVKTDLSFDPVQRIGLDAGLVDVKICAIDNTWSGLKFVYRLKDRSKPQKGAKSTK
jgi:ABC-type Na+ transport system ATPase subunit NatA